MKKVEKAGQHPELHSEGKILEVIPVILDQIGQPMMLPPALWRVEGWVLGFTEPRAITGTPWTLHMPMRSAIPGSSSQHPHQLSFIVRVLEDGEHPTTGVIDPAAVKAALRAYREEWHPMEVS